MDNNSGMFQIISNNQQLIDVLLLYFTGQFLKKNLNGFLFKSFLHY